MSESNEEMLSRVRMMAQGTYDTWDHSDSDVLALQYVLERLEQAQYVEQKALEHAARLEERLEQCEAAMVTFERAAQDGFGIAKEYRQQIALASMHRKGTADDKERMSILDERMKRLAKVLVARAALGE